MSDASVRHCSKCKEPIYACYCDSDATLEQEIEEAFYRAIDKEEPMDMEEIYTLRIIREGGSFQAMEGKTPDDKFNKRMVALMLCNIAEHLDPELIRQKAEGTTND